MADIARLAGVAVSTVSRALAGSPLVNEKTRARVAELAASLNYSVNVGAQNLRLKQINTIAVIVPYDTATRQSLSDPFFLALIGSIADACTKRGFDMLLSRVDAEHLNDAGRPYTTGRALGIILIGQWHHHDQLNELALRRVPLVVWGAKLPQQLYCTVGSDNLAGGRLAVEHLLNQGAQHIAFLGDPSLPEIAQRYEGYVQAHRARGLSPTPALCRPVPFVSAAIEQDLDALLDSGEPLDAIFASSDLVAMTAISTLRRHGRRVPEDVAVIGYDDIALAVHYQPPLSTVRQSIDVAGEALVGALIAQLEGEGTLPVELPTELVLRQTA
ncbi:LacI family DNA-binding transcriptional regulator [Paucibacter sp. hw1]|uniref:LacI family DNA-binding transcriptional regulator n=2 Tax=Roseateles koreensis TaxID=2987526 RepID=A0ABT5KR84_9BURK|nr:LacI family DNA-binding transcriptional regulator [Roseateles koreensis]MDC8785404.1 LacI family DNA-binding transcriptional regulator [Roseateles koreensis]